MSKAAPKIFISYRRADSSGHTGRLADKLQSAFGEDSIFIDILTIAPGADYRKIIEQAINDCDVLLAVIGKNWLSKEEPEDTADWVRVEITTALKRDVLVIPVLVQGTKMPARSELPADLEDLTYRNAFEISDTRWAQDVDSLIAYLKRAASEPRALGKEDVFAYGSGYTDSPPSAVRTLLQNQEQRQHESEREPRLKFFLNTSWLKISVTAFSFIAVITIGLLLISQTNFINPRSPVSAPSATPTPNLSSEDAAIQVWVNTDPKSNTYHCPGTKWYGKTKVGEYMSQGEAQQQGYQPAYGKVCR